MRVDLNCDMGESFGAWRMGNDAAILDYVSSANIACGFHAGDPGTMRATVQAAVAKGVAIGAHPSFPDLQGFGRRPMTLRPEEVYDLCVYQIGALAAFARAAGGRLHHVKAHGALSNMAARESALAEALTQAARDVDPDLISYAQAGTELVRAAEKLGLPYASEVFADRSYLEDGQLTPRGRPGAMIEDADAAIAQVLRMLREGRVRSITGKDVAVRADTVCVHGDQPHALEFARRLRAALAREGVTVAPC
jgi:UPF0271 protein